MEGGLQVGRVGAGALILAAVLALAQAFNGCETSARVPRLAVHTTTLRVADAAPPGGRGLGAFALGAAVLPDQAVTASEVIPPGRPAITVPILMYHYIRVNPIASDRLGFGLSVAPADFAAQVTWLAAAGYHAIDLLDLERYLSGVQNLPSRPVVLTFDDGYEDFYTTAYPILRAHHFTAVAYVVSGFIGRPRYLTAAQVVELDADGIEIGAHTVTHPDLTLLGPVNLHHEVADAKAMLEGLLKHPVLDFCYPSGKLNAGVIHQVEAAGFHSATTTALGTAHSLADRFTWTRVRVQGGEPLATFVQNLGPVEPTVPVVPVPAATPLASTPLSLNERQ